jgi:hypothetical protein
MAKYIAPSTKETAFNCPHCGALAKQYWHSVFCEYQKDDKPLPQIWAKDLNVEEVFKGVKDKDKKEEYIALVKELQLGFPTKATERTDTYRMPLLFNVHMSECFNCKKVALWIYDSIVYPVHVEAQQPNTDLPDEIKRDYLEASSILSLSPRGSCALSRLAIQKLLKHFGLSGQNINSDIAALVSQGLDQRIQRALDIVRVVGNNAVHPGQVDLTDDRSTAETLLRLINLIADRMISEPREVDEVYAKLPSGAREAIEKRDSGKA